MTEKESEPTICKNCQHSLIAKGTLFNLVYGKTEEIEEIIVNYINGTQKSEFDEDIQKQWNKEGKYQYYVNRPKPEPKPKPWYKKILFWKKGERDES